jgi:hypothetical protein
VRHDVYIENDSSGFSVIPSSAVADIILDGRDDDRRFALEQRALLLILNGDDSFAARLVANENLSAEEDAEWVACARWRLDVPCGRILLCGGFDPRVLEDWAEGRDHFPGCVHAIDVPAGHYNVDLYTHRPTASGRVIEESWPLPLGAWFRRDYPGEPFPQWMAEEFEQIPEFDPGHEDDWENFDAALRAARLAVSERLSDVIGYLIHLRPFSPESPLSALPDDGWFEIETGARVPPRCPRGLATGARPAD